LPGKKEDRENKIKETYSENTEGFVHDFGRKAYGMNFSTLGNIFSWFLTGQALLSFGYFK